MPSIVGDICPYSKRTENNDIYQLRLYGMVQTVWRERGARISPVKFERRVPRNAFRSSGYAHPAVQQRDWGALG